MNRRLVYNDDYFNTTLRDGDDTMGVAFVAPLIAAAPGIFQSIMGLFGGGRKAQFQGLAEISTAGQQATSALDKIKAGLASGHMSPAQAVSEAQRIVQQFSDPSIVYPAKKGKDAEARNSFIATLNQGLQQIQSLAANAPAANASGSLGGISTNTLLIVGGGLLAVMMLKNDS